MYDRLLVFVLGAWLATAVFMGVVATANFKTVDAILAPGYRAELESRIAPRTAAEERPILRYLASELNRRFFRWTAWTELLLAALALALSWPRSGRRYVALALTFVTLVLVFYLMPAILTGGPPLDFVPRPFPPEWAAAGASFFRFHGIYMAVALAKLVLLVALTAMALRGATPKTP